MSLGGSSGGDGQRLRGQAGVGDSHLLTAVQGDVAG